MNLLDQVVSLEIAKRLKELGVDKLSCFEWQYIPHKDQWEVFPKFPNQKHNLGYPAYSVGELGEILPGLILIQGDRFYLTMDCEKNPFYEDMPKSSEMYAKDQEDDDSEADARAKCLIMLIENNLIDVKKVNDE